MDRTRYTYFFCLFLWKVVLNNAIKGKSSMNCLLDIISYSIHRESDNYKVVSITEILSIRT